MAETGQVTHLLERWRAGDEEAFRQLLPLVYGELKRVARGARLEPGRGQTLRTTALVHEAFLRLVGQDRARFENRSHFLSVAAQAMRRVLVDHERRRRAAKRGGTAEPLPLIEIDAPVAVEITPDLIDLHEALGELARIDERQARLVELRYFGGLTIPEAAQVLRVSRATVEREWTVARVWLRRRLSAAPAAS